MSDGYSTEEAYEKLEAMSSSLSGVANDVEGFEYSSIPPWKVEKILTSLTRLFNELDFFIQDLGMHDGEDNTPYCPWDLVNK
jgi:hypothetical protein